MDTFEIKSWDENTVEEIEGGGKLTRAKTVFVLSGAVEGEQAAETLMCYRADGTASYIGQDRVVGRIGERTGSFVLQGGGTYDGTEARSTSTVVPGSGTGELRGLRGEFTSVSTSTERNYSFDYDFE